MDRDPSAEVTNALERSFSDARRLRADFTRFMMQYKFGIDEVLTKVSILQEEFEHLHSYNPIEHVGSRLKSPESIVEKLTRKGADPSFDSIGTSITDIAGVRITCSFIADTYRVFEMLTAQSDIRVIQVKDYISHPKPNGYKSLHALIEVPVFMSNGPVPVTVELQIRTIAMDFWASLEHKIYYKYDGHVPAGLADDLTETARIADDLDRRMERLHEEVQVLNPIDSDREHDQVDDRLVLRLQQLREQFRAGSAQA